MNIEPLTLEGTRIRLEPFSMNHFDDLAEFAYDETIWRWTLNKVSSPNDLKKYIADALECQKQGNCLPFATIEKQSGKAIGATRFGGIDTANRHVEIGWTWISPRWQRSFVNTEAKFLMLCHAFEVWKCLRVEIVTDVLNEKSRAAISRIGGRFEGIRRADFVTHSGRIRDTAMFSIIDAEWAEIKKNLASKLAQ